MDELVATLRDLEANDAVRCIVLGGNERAFAAGADVAELTAGSAISLYQERRIDRWDAIRALVELVAMLAFRSFNCARSFGEAAIPSSPTA